MKKEPPMCLEMLANVQELLIPVPVKYTPQLCGLVKFFILQLKVPPI